MKAQPSSKGKQNQTLKSKDRGLKMAGILKGKRGCKRTSEGGTEKSVLSGLCSLRTKGGLRTGRMEKYLKV